MTDGRAKTVPRRIRHTSRRNFAETRFDELNARYCFRPDCGTGGHRLGRLRSVHVRFVSPPHSSGASWEGEYDPKRKVIHLPRRSTHGPDYVDKQTMLHEMCHIGSLGHGLRFRKKLRHLADQGETWAADEAAGYEGPGTLWRDEKENIRDNLQQIAYEMKTRPSFREVERMIAANRAMRIAELRKYVPWLRSAWRKAVEDADRYDRLQARTVAERIQVYADFLKSIDEKKKAKP